jgi:hypothetical protein
MARKVKALPQHLYFARVIRTYPDGGVYDSLEGPYSTAGAAKSRLTRMLGSENWSRRNGAVITSHLMRTTTHWEEIDNG